MVMVLHRRLGLSDAPGARVWLIDAGVAIAVGAAQVAAAVAAASNHSARVGTGGLVLLGVAAAPLVVRRRFPVAALTATFVLTLAYACTPDFQGPVWAALTVAFGTAVYLRERTAAIISLVAGYVAFQWGPALVGTHPAPTALSALGLAALLGAMLAVAEWVRLRKARSLALARSAEEMARRVAGEERLRIARDLHDVVAHNISVINVTANTALHVADRHPERARIALATINDVSRQALMELRSVLGVLRHADDQIPLAPAGGLGQLDVLVHRAALAGVATRVEQRGIRVAVPTNVDLAAHRIIQEALTNAVRHSGGHNAVVRIDYDQDGLCVEVDDDGTAGGLVFGHGTGHGVVGMTERAAAVGGYLEAGPRPSGGFRVRAWLPFERSAP